MIDNMQKTTPLNKNTGLGIRLKNAREAMHLSEKDAAARLNLSHRFIIIMESENFEDGLPATFMRGYIRSYAKILNIPEAEIETALENLGMNVPTTVTITPKLNTSLTDNNDSYIRWLTYLIIMVLVVLVGIWWSTHSRDTNTATTSTATTAVTTQTIASPPPATHVAATPGAASTAATPTSIIMPSANAAAPVLPTTQPLPQQSAAPAAVIAPRIPQNTTIPAAPVTNPAALPIAPTSANPITAAAAPASNANQPVADATPVSPPKPSQRSRQPRPEQPHMKMVAPEPGLDISDVGNED